MLRVQNLTKSYGDQVLLDEVEFLMTPGERLGLVGRNGSGKTTLFRMLLGDEHPDSGRIILPRGYRIGSLSQHLVFTRPTVLEECCLALGDRVDEETYRAEAALMGLGFTREDFDRAPAMFSGGYQIRINLAKLLVEEPNLLLLDEPTNYLDILSVRWLERFLRSWKNEMVIVSHDRQFLTRVTTHTLAIHRRGLRRMEGSIEKLFEQIAIEEEVHEKTRVNEEKKRKQEYRFIERFRYKASKAKAVQSRIKQMEKRDNLEALSSERDLDFRFRDAPFHATKMLEVSGLTFGFDDGPDLVQDLSLAINKGDRIGIVGKNGKGKTTLLNLLAGELEPRRGGLQSNPNVVQAYFGQTNIDRLDHSQTVEQAILEVHPEHSRTAARGICGLMMFEGDLAEKKVSVLSGGERSRVLLGKLLVCPSNLLLLDEPTNHLDVESVESLLEAIEAFAGGVLIVTHSELILERVCNRLVVFDGGVPRVFEGGYRDFLDRIGWADEAETGKTSRKMPGQKTQKNPKEQRRQRAKLMAERSKALAPLKRETEALEAEIVKLEAAVTTEHAELAELANSGSSDRITALARSAKKKQRRIDRAFEELETVSDKISGMTADFEARMSQF